MTKKHSRMDKLKNKDRNPCVLRWVSFLIMLLWMAVIFFFSSQPAVESSDVSGHFSYRIAETIGSFTGQAWEEQEVASVAEKIEFPLRKLAHMTEYGILGTLALLFFSTFQVKKKAYLFAFCTAFFYACTDEFHQTFVAGRDGNLGDVLIDCFGALVFLLLAYGLSAMFLHLKRPEKLGKV